MPARRNTPARRRMTCPECSKDVSYTHPWVPNTGPGSDSLMRDYDTRLLKEHNRPQTTEPCPVNGPNGLGLYMPRERGLTP